MNVILFTEGLLILNISRIKKSFFHSHIKTYATQNYLYELDYDLAEMFPCSHTLWLYMPTSDTSSQAYFKVLTVTIKVKVEVNYTCLYSCSYVYMNMYMYNNIRIWL